MKKLCLFSLMLLLFINIIPLQASSLEISNEVFAEEENRIIVEKCTYIDNEQTGNKPSEKLVKKIKKGMSVPEVIDLLGEPYDWTKYRKTYLKEELLSSKRTKFINVAIWKLENEKTLSILIEIPEYTDKEMDYMEFLYEFGTVSKKYMIDKVEVKDSEIPIICNPYDYLDKEREHVPSAKDFKKIVPGMSICETLRILGRPHEWGLVLGGVADLVWCLDDGTRIRVSPDFTSEYYSADEESQNDSRFCAENRIVARVTVEYDAYNNEGDKNIVGYIALGLGIAAVIVVGVVVIIYCRKHKKTVNKIE